MSVFDNDAAKIFYQLFIRYDTLSSNVAIIGERTKFMRQIEHLAKYCRDNNLQMKLNPQKTKFTIIYEDQVVNYISIQTEKDLVGLTFKKFI